MNLSFNLQDPEYKEIFEVLAGLKRAEEVAQFLVDLCTPKELMALASRWQVAKLVEQGVSYREICEATGASTATITRVGRCLQFGKGYKSVLQRRARKAKP